MKVERVAAVSERALTDELPERADFAVAGTRSKRASTAWRCAAAPSPKRRMIGAVSPAATSVCHSASSTRPHSRSSSEAVGAR